MLGKLAILALLALLPVALAAPLAVSEVSFFLYNVREEISIYGSLIALYESDDQLLFGIILVLSVIGPYIRLLLMAFAAFARSAVALRLKPALDLVGRFSLIDVIIISLLVISFRVPEFKLQWGFYFVLCLWVMDMFASFSIWRRLRREESRAPARAPDAPALRHDPALDRPKEPALERAETTREDHAPPEPVAAFDAEAPPPPLTLRSVAGASRRGRGSRRGASWRPDRS